MQFAVEELSFGTYDVHGIATFPFVLAVLSFVVLLISVRLGLLSRNGPWKLKEDPREDFDLIMASSLTLLGLIIGFSFSMALTRYDQRKRCEADEANAIGTEYTRADLLLAQTRRDVRGLLRNISTNAFHSIQISIISSFASSMPLLRKSRAKCGPRSTIRLSKPERRDRSRRFRHERRVELGGYTQAARWNKIPTAAWCLMLAIAVLSCNLLLGYQRVALQRGESCSSSCRFLYPFRFSSWPTLTAPIPASFECIRKTC